MANTARLTTVRVARRSAAVLRDAWLMVGITIALFLVLEGAYRAQGAIRRAFAQREVTAPRPDDPQAGAPWFKDWVNVHALAMPIRYDPYRGFWSLPLERKYIHVDSSGRRVTPQPMPLSAHPRRIFMLGASTMWGYSTPDSSTIPALVAKGLRDRGITEVEVVNLAQISYNTLQANITLGLELSRENVPAVAVFLTGTADTWAAQAGALGGTIDYYRAEQRWNNGGSDVRRQLGALAQRSELVTRIATMTGPHTHNETPSVPCASLAAHFRNLVRETEALGNTFGFRVAFFGPPALATTHKRKTRYEEWFQARVDARDARVGDYLRACAPVGDSAMADRLHRSYFPLHALFDGDTTAVFTDEAHLTEHGNAVVAARMVDVIAPMLR